ncbi:uncharacterized protein PADG_11268 [Paracoccidioides brasiliensis Pb18]|uniref:Uncharacterized protein n=1 Tax=Paracoccidioides brasiliensis (strain Pb18) TaxID=502780 RepID=A0A0A0HWJ7_PARBD|nr:uncharacterized protein PADG_11268 [Paracoccidioides brasiliensis Pb18]KGM92451.1 hypothetical protein PADG_11268 [Paracoccidioides brasiliensis Pb18]
MGTPRLPGPDGNPGDTVQASNAKVHLRHFGSGVILSSNKKQLPHSAKILLSRWKMLLHRGLRKRAGTCWKAKKMIMYIEDLAELACVVPQSLR